MLQHTIIGCFQCGISQRWHWSSEVQEVCRTIVWPLHKINPNQQCTWVQDTFMHVARIWNWALFLVFVCSSIDGYGWTALSSLNWHNRHYVEVCSTWLLGLCGSHGNLFVQPQFINLTWWNFSISGFVWTNTGIQKTLSSVVNGFWCCVPIVITNFLQNPYHVFFWGTHNTKTGTSVMIRQKEAFIYQGRVDFGRGFFAKQPIVKGLGCKYTTSLLGGIFSWCSC